MIRTGLTTCAPTKRVGIMLSGTVNLSPQGLIEVGILQS
jgi:hypothetical protein